MRLLYLYLSFLLILAVPAKTQAQDVATPEEAAETAAQAWIALVDQGEYAASWEAAAPLFRQAVTPDQWAAAVQQARGPLGALQSRTLKQAQHTTALPNAPAGEYVVIEYTSRFANLEEGAEMVVMRREAEDWQAAGYFVRPAQ